MQNVAGGMFGMPALETLADGDSFVGRLLRTLPLEVIRAADMQDYPWRYLFHDSQPKNLPRGWQLLFEAGHSQQIAAIHLKEILRGGATLETCWWKELGKANDKGDLDRADHAADKLLKSILPDPEGRQWLNDFPLEFREEAEERRQRLVQAAKERSSADKARALLEGEGTTQLIPEVSQLVFELIRGWLRVGAEGSPGYCFFTDAVLAKVLRGVVGKPALTDKNVVRTRELLGLKKATIFVYSATMGTGGLWRFSDRNGDPFC
jgi:hypothetical protein